MRLGMVAVKDSGAVEIAYKVPHILKELYMKEVVEKLAK